MGKARISGTDAIFPWYLPSVHGGPHRCRSCGHGGAGCVLFSPLCFHYSVTRGFWLTRDSATHTASRDKSKYPEEATQQDMDIGFFYKAWRSPMTSIFTPRKMWRGPLECPFQTLILLKESSSRRHFLWRKCNYLLAPRGLEKAQYRRWVLERTSGLWAVGEPMKHPDTQKTTQGRGQPQAAHAAHHAKSQLKRSTR